MYSTFHTSVTLTASIFYECMYSNNDSNNRHIGLLCVMKVHYLLATTVSVNVNYYCYMIIDNNTSLCV